MSGAKDMNPDSAKRIAQDTMKLCVCCLLVEIAAPLQILTAFILRPSRAPGGQGGDIR